MGTIITKGILEGHLHCRYKGYLKKNGIEGEKTKYEILQSELREKYLTDYCERLKKTTDTFYEATKKLTGKDFGKGYDHIFNGTVKSDNLSLEIDVLEKVPIKDKKITFSYYPILVSANEKVSKIDKELISCLSYMLNGSQIIVPNYGKIVYGRNLRILQVKMADNVSIIEEIVKEINLNSEPQLILNDHCQICEYSTHCSSKAKKEDNLSLLNRASPKIINKYNKKGIFTIQQLSYLYRPRRSRKRGANQKVLHNLEIQALAIRTNKIYVHQLPNITRRPVELYLDIEGIPDSASYYLIGLLILSGQQSHYVSFWADRESEEVNIWQYFLLELSKYPEAPIYHYGSYEPKAIKFLGKRFKTDISEVLCRFVNVTSTVYGKIYFPTYSNRLKEIGRYLGASWSSKNATGIQSLVWRHRWLETHNKKYKQLLVKYNNEDCQALKLLLDKLSKIEDSADNLSEVDFVGKPKKIFSEIGTEIYKEFDAILKFGHETYKSNKISFQDIRRKDSSTKRKPGAVLGHEGRSRKVPKARKSIVVPIKRICPIHKLKLIKSPKTVQRTVTDLVFTKNTIRKTVIKYIGNKSYCPECQKYFSPLQIDIIANNHFGHNFKSWVVYQRLTLRLPFRIIKLNLQEMFNEHISEGGLNNFFKTFPSFYKLTERNNLKTVIQSDFVHMDETKINVKGINHYVWIFTNGREVVFKRSETREVEMVKDVLKNFQGILVSDFYPGFDSLKCRHQKCWVHLIRDINDDLWKNPFDKEYEKFVMELRNLILPIFESVEKYGLKKRHFNKFRKGIDRFYRRKITGIDYRSEITVKYQNRLKKYWYTLFTFTEFDNIPWNNNMAERGLRHLAVQRKISTHFNKGIDNYLFFLGIMQTCRFHKISFLKFLLSGKKDMSR